MSKGSQLFVVLFELKNEKRTLETFTGAIVNAVDGWSQVSVVAVKLLPKGTKTPLSGPEVKKKV